MISEISNRIYRNKTILKYKKICKYININTNKLYKLLFIRLLIALITFLISLIIVNNFIYSLILTIIIYIVLTYIFFYLKIYLKNYKLEKEVVNTFEIFIDYLNKGYTIKKAFNSLFNNIDNNLVKDIKIYLDKEKYGLSFKECLIKYKDYTYSNCIKNIFIIIIDTYNDNLNNNLSKKINLLKDINKNERLNLDIIKYKLVLYSILLLIPIIILIIFSSNIIEYIS